MTWVLEYSGVWDHAEFRALMILAGAADDEGHAQLPLARIADLMCRSARQAQRVLAGLCESGYIRPAATDQWDLPVGAA